MRYAYGRGDKAIGTDEEFLSSRRRGGGGGGERGGGRVRGKDDDDDDDDNNNNNSDNNSDDNADADAVVVQIGGRRRRDRDDNNECERYGERCDDRYDDEEEEEEEEVEEQKEKEKGVGRGNFTNLDLNSLAFLQDHEASPPHGASLLMRSSSSSSSFSLLNRRRQYQQQQLQQQQNQKQQQKKSGLATDSYAYASKYSEVDDEDDHYYCYHGRFHDDGDGDVENKNVGVEKMLDWKSVDAQLSSKTKRRRRRKRDVLLFAFVFTVFIFLGNVYKTTRILSLTATTSSLASSPSPSLIFARDTRKNSVANDEEEDEDDERVEEEEEMQGEREEMKENRSERKREKKETFSFLPMERITLLSPQRMIELSERKNDGADANDAYDFVSLADKRSAIATTIKWAYDGYMKVFPADELDPISGRGLEWFHVALTAIDAVDTFALAGLDEEFEFVKEFVRSGKPMFTAAGRSSVFESTIRMMGGFLAAHHLEQKNSGIEATMDEKGDNFTTNFYFLEKARELADKLKIAFDTPTGIPRTDVDFSTGKAHDDEKGTNGLAQATTLTLEWECLEATLMEVVVLDGAEKRKGEFTRYGDYVRRANEAVHKLASDADYGLLPDKIGVEQLKAHGMVKLGANGDSYYEYLLKSWIHRGKPQGGEKEYVRAMDGIFLRLVQRTQNHEHNTSGLIYVGEMTYPSSRGARLEKKMDHLVCFLPGILALGHLHGVGKEFGSSASSEEEKKEFRAKVNSLRLDEKEASHHLALAKELMRTCVAMYERMPLGLHPEIAKFDQDENNVVKCFGGDLCVSVNDAHSILRPETVESLFVLYRVTKDESFRRQGWRMWQNWERYSRVDTGGYASIASVLENPPGRKKGKQESFFLSETLKYLFLLFSDDKVVPLECFVFNTEGHPLPIMHRRMSNVRECVESVLSEKK
jgi:hypothetical protein